MYKKQVLFLITTLNAHPFQLSDQQNNLHFQKLMIVR